MGHAVIEHISGIRIELLEVHFNEERIFKGAVAIALEIKIAGI